ncbi:hypothetical protein IP84_05105 [beta proteobacterium AAP99]|nr:hypothetical protein IP84_05105 [beta proteobacterium AAP99]
MLRSPQTHTMLQTLLSPLGIPGIFLIAQAVLLAWAPSLQLDRCVWRVSVGCAALAYSVSASWVIVYTQRPGSTFSVSLSDLPYVLGSMTTCLLPFALVGVVWSLFRTDKPSTALKLTLLAIAVLLAPSMPWLAISWFLMGV